MTNDETPNIKNIMQAAQVMQEKMRQIQHELADTEIIGMSADNLVAISMTGRYVVKNVQLNPIVLTYEKTVLEELLLNAINNANRNAEKLSQDKLLHLSKNIDAVDQK